MMASSRLASRSRWFCSVWRYKVRQHDSQGITLTHAVKHNDPSGIGTWELRTYWSLADLLLDIGIIHNNIISLGIGQHSRQCTALVKNKLIGDGLNYTIFNLPVIQLKPITRRLRCVHYDLSIGIKSDDLEWPWTHVYLINGAR